MPPKSIYLQKAEELKKILLPCSSTVIVTHDYPDPDCLAAAMGMQQLLTFWGVKSTQITFGGFIGRAENRAMIRFLNIQAVPMMLIDFADFEKIILVDSYPGEGNVSLDKENRVDVVIDHHPHVVPPDAPFYSYIRKDIGATSTIITLLLRVVGCPISSDLATALFYGIKTDTNYLAKHSTEEDLHCYKDLFNFINHSLLSQIESPDRDAEYFRILHRSAESMTVYHESIGHIHLGSVSAPDYIAEIADLFHSLDKIEWMICSAIFKNQIFFSIRSKKEVTAGYIAENIAQTLRGSGGGHATKAAGQLPIKGIKKEEAVASFIQTFRTILGIENVQGQSILE